MDDRTIARLRTVAIGLAGLVAAIHLLHTSEGGPALLVYANVGYLGSPLPPLFVAGGFTAVFAAFLIHFDVYRRPAYLLAAAVGASFFLGFVAWHTLLDHGAFWPYIEGTGHDHAHPIVVVFEHFVAGPVVFVSKVAEFALVVVGLVLYRVDVAEKRVDVAAVGADADGDTRQL